MYCVYGIDNKGDKKFFSSFYTSCNAIAYCCWMNWQGTDDYDNHYHLTIIEEDDA